MMAAIARITFAGREFFVDARNAAKLDDPEPMLECVAEVRDGDVFLDVGAGEGLYALRAALMGAWVYAFEPHKPSRDTLVDNATFGLVGKTFPHGIAVSSYALFDGGLYPDDLRREVWGRHYPQERVDVTTLDVWMGAGHMPTPRVDWLKLDVEGAELGVLLGGARTIQKQRPTLLIEDHDGVNPDPACVVSRYAERVNSSARIHELLTSWGYTIESRPWGSGRKFLVARSR
jgi:FkbM family methyltransferase